MFNYKDNRVAFDFLFIIFSFVPFFFTKLSFLSWCINIIISFLVFIDQLINFRNQALQREEKK